MLTAEVCKSELNTVNCSQSEISAESTGNQQPWKSGVQCLIATGTSCKHPLISTQMRLLLSTCTDMAKQTSRLSPRVSFSTGVFQPLPAPASGYSGREGVSRAEPGAFLQHKTPAENKQWADWVSRLPKCAEPELREPRPASICSQDEVQAAPRHQRQLHPCCFRVPDHLFEAVWAFTKGEGFMHMVYNKRTKAESRYEWIIMQI